MIKKLKYRELSNTYKNKNFLTLKNISILLSFKEKKTYNLKNIPGQVFIFGGYLHIILKEGNQVRIGLEFRMRTRNPFYFKKLE